MAMFGVHDERLSITAKRRFGDRAGSLAKTNERLGMGFRTRRNTLPPFLHAPNGNCVPLPWLKTGGPLPTRALPRDSNPEARQRVADRIHHLHQLRMRLLK